MLLNLNNGFPQSETNENPNKLTKIYSIYNIALQYSHIIYERYVCLVLLKS